MMSLNKLYNGCAYGVKGDLHMVGFTVSNQPERAFLVGLGLRGSRPLLSVEDSLNELALLSKTAGLDVVGHTHQILNQIDPATFIGSGKLDEIAEQILALEATVVIFDDELSPRHQREIEKRLGEKVKVLDRSALILDIFAQHASTREGALQVELAQYEYRLPRLTRQWTHLARQAGGAGARGGVGVGLRGPGETQLEVDRREIRRKIAKLQSDLERVRSHREQHRVQRKKTGIAVIALVGYTNAGKSTLLNQLSGANVYVADQLFATLDPTTRRVTLPSGRDVLFTDTVGFIQKLPTTLIAAFRATLEEISEADLILHVVDASHKNVQQHIEAVEDTLAEIDIPPIPRVLVWNKIDKLSSPLQSHTLDASYLAEVQLSAQTRFGVDELLLVIDSLMSKWFIPTTLLIPYDRGDLVDKLYRMGSVLQQSHTLEGVVLQVQLPPELASDMLVYRIEG